MRQPFDRLLLGRTLAGRYEIEEVIGAGGMSVVFRGRDGTLGRPVAVKVVALPAESEALRDNLRERFRREAANAARISPHPNVVQIYDYGTDAELDLDFIVMELLRGRDLKEALARSGGPPPYPEAMRILREAARGLAAGHRTGIVHRDVKPANVFLVGEEGLEGVRLLDFGIAKPMEQDGEDSLTTIGQLPHSPAYASPEQVDPGAPVGPPSDVYQLGLIGYELLTGDRPFSDAERLRIRGGEDLPLVDTPRWTAVPAPVREVIARALHRRPEERPADAAEFAEALAAAEDATILHPAAVAPPDDATIAAPEPPRAAPPPPPTTPVVVEPTPHRAPPPPPVTGVPVGARPARRISPVMWIAPLALLLLVALIALTRRGGDDEGRTASAAPVPAPPPDSSETAALDDEFLRLQGTIAASDLSDSTAAGTEADPDAPPADAVPGAPPVAAAPVDEREKGKEGRTPAENAEEVQRVILDLNAAWVEGDLDRHMSHYADRVDYYSEDDASRAFVRADRARDMRKYDDRVMTVRRQAVTFPSPDRARALVDKTWTFTGSGERWNGSMRQELILVRREGSWKIVSEKENEVYFSRKTPLR